MHSPGRACLVLLLSLVCSFLPSCCGTTLLGSVVTNVGVVLPTIVNLYQLQTNNVSIELLLGSADATITALLASDVDFSVIGVPLSAEQAAAYPNTTLVPAVGGAIVPVYRLDALNSSAAPLTFSGATLAFIYAGNITNWSDPLIQADNVGVVLPDLNITVAYQADPRAYTLQFLSFLVGSEPSTADILPPSELPVWPIDRYAASYGGIGATGVIAYVVNSNGAIGFGIQQAALPYDATIASLVNRAGYTVAPTLASIQYAMFELLTANNLTHFPDSTNPSSAYAWPVVSVEYLLLHNDYSPRGCEVRSAVLAFWLWFYESVASYSSIAANFVVVATPTLVQQQLSITATLTSKITCNGQPLHASQSSGTTATVTIYAPSRLNQGLVAMSDFYTINATDVQLNVEWATSDQSLTIGNDGLGLAFYYESEITNATVTPLDTAINHILPSFLTSIVYTYNLHLSDTVTLNTSVELVIDFPTALRIIIGNITDWHDPRMLALNPVLATILDSEPAPTTWIFACVGNAATSPIYNAIGVMLGSAATVDPEIVSLFTEAGEVGVFTAFADCSYLPGVRWQFATQEQSIAALVSNVPGAIGYAMDLNGQSAGQFAMRYPLIVDASTGATTHAVRRSTPEALLACAETGFDAATLTIDVVIAAATNTDCYPMTQVVYAQVPHVYPLEQGAIALATVEFLDWLYTQPALDTYGYSNMLVRTSDVPAIQTALLTALQSITTSDGNPLIRLPISWTLNSAVSAVAIMLAALAAVLTSVAMAVTVRYAKDAVFRSSSPLFMLVSFVGLLHLCLAMWLLTYTVNDTVCNLWNASLQLGFTLVFAPLFAKAYRIYRIFGRRKLKVVKLTNRRLLLGVLVVVLLDAMYTLVWLNVSAPSALLVVRQETVYTAGETAIQEYDYLVCAYEGHSRGFMLAISILKLASLLVGVLLAFSTRQVTSQFNESKMISLTIYNMVFAIGVIVPIFFLVAATGDVAILLLLFVIAEITYFTLAALFLPKVLAYSAARRSIIAEHSIGGSTPGDGSQQYSFLSFTQLNSPALIQPYIGALEKHLLEAKKLLTDMKRTGIHKPLPRPTVSVDPSLKASARRSVGSLESADASSLQPSDNQPAAQLLSPHSSQHQHDVVSPHHKAGPQSATSDERRLAWSRKRSSSIVPDEAKPTVAETAGEAETTALPGVTEVGGEGGQQVAGIQHVMTASVVEGLEDGRPFVAMDDGPTPRTEELTNAT